MSSSLLQVPRDRVAPRLHPPAADEGAADWYACYTMAQSEKKAEQLLRRRGYESYLPIVPVVRQWSDRRRRIEAPLFAGYVFVRAPGALLGGVVATPGVAAIVRFDGRPVRIPDAEIDNITQFVRALATTGHVPVRVRLHAGQRVRVVAGPFEGVSGIVRQVRGPARVLVGLACIGVGFEIEVPVEHVKRMAAEARGERGDG